MWLKRPGTWRIGDVNIVDSEILAGAQIDRWLSGLKYLIINSVPC